MTPAVANSPIETAEASERAAREFDAIFREHADLVFGTAYGITARREDAEDVLQTVFIRLWRRDVPVQFHKSPKAYLYRAAINQSLNILKTRKRHPTTDLAGADVVADTSSSEQDEALQRKLYEAIAQLPAEVAEILILRYLHGYTDAAIATLLGKSRVTIAVRLHRAKAQLRRLLRLSLGEEL